MVRVRWWPRSASSAWVAIHPATSSVARASPADALGPYAARAATTRSPLTTGAITAPRTGQSGSEQLHLAGPQDDGVTGAQDLLGVRAGVPGVVVGDAVPGQQGAGVGDRDGR